MDEVDIDNVEDLNELEARLYAQIHHEATDECNNLESGKQFQSSDGEQLLNANPYNQDAAGGNENYETSSNTNRILSRRYWASGENSAKQQSTNQRFIRNPFKTPNPQKQQNSDIQLLNKSHNQVAENQSSTAAISKTIENSNVMKEKSSKTHTDKSATTIITKSVITSSLSPERIPLETVPPLLSASNETKKNKNEPLQARDQQNSKQKQPNKTANKSNLKLNPVADWIKRNRNQTNKKANNNNNNNNNNNRNLNVENLKDSKEGPFIKQKQKLQKAKRMEDKKQKSKRAKNAAAAMANKLKDVAVIVIDSENESDNSDVVMIPIPPPPTFTVTDSGDEDDKNNVLIVIEHEENAVDSSDVQMSSTSSCFIKPQQTTPQSLAAATDSAEKRFENSSRCTSPCSIQSSDDFIGQNDRSRLLTGATSGMADDEDLLVLTTDINSLLEVPQSAQQSVNDRNTTQKEENLAKSRVEQVEENVGTNDSLEFTAPKTIQVQREADYRVDQCQFRALDVYESESDITDSVYSKGAIKPTVIRQIDTSSDEIEDIGSCSQRTKRLRKRRASSSNKESDPNNDNAASSSDNNEDKEEGKDEFEEDDNNILSTSIPFIARGPAVERCKPRKRSRTLSSCSPIISRRKSAKTMASPDHMSDTEFIATLNNLAQGQEGEAILKAENEAEADESDSESENVPTAREMAEKILGLHTEKSNEIPNCDMAVPEDVLNELDKVFETIDQLDEREKRRSQSTTPNGTVKISDSSDSDIEKHLTYKTLPNEDTQIIKYSPDTSKSIRSIEKRYKKNGSPIYNIIISRGQRSPGGLGWNEEMRKFYNDSWNGENFLLHRVLQKINPDKNLWKIYTEDRFNIKSNRRHNNLKCTNCCEFGHMRSKCKRPKKPMICYMCGESGHYEPRCPNTICLRCGNKTQVFTKMCNGCSYQNRLLCPICKVRGHSLDFCPDKWRRYHSTTEPNAYPNSTISYNPRKYCCICGGRGHLSDNCRSAVRFMEYPTIVSTVKSHQKSYGDVPVKTPHNGIALNLMYEPCQEYKFDLVQRTTFDKYYGRFLKAVGLDYLLKRRLCANAETIETDDTVAKKAKRLSKKYVACPYSKAGKANRKNLETNLENAPNQVQEITESGNTEEQNVAVAGNQEIDVITVEDISNDVVSGNEVELIGSTMSDDNLDNIQLNTINERPSITENVEKFKSPKTVTSSLVAPSKTNTEPPLVLDSDSNYSFSEHFDVPSTSAVAASDAPAKIQIISPNEESSLTADHTRQKPREMEALPDFIPLVDSTEDMYDDNNEDNNNSLAVAGVSRRFVAANTDDETFESEEISRRCSISPLSELPCEAKIYLTHFHSKYLLSPVGNAFLVKNSRAHKLRARLDFTSIGHVLVIFGLPSNQDKFQRELLLKYRELSDQNYQKQSHSNHNVPKRTDVLIRFLRDNITQLLNNLGNVNHLLKRLQFLERQQSKSGYKLAEKVRRSLNMILVGQAGLQDGTRHLDKLLLSLKTLINDYNSEDITPPELRSEITDHWKVIFTPYRHNNYQQLADTYNRLISKNRMPKLVIDPILLGQKLLDTSLSEEQKQKLEQTRPSTSNAANVSEPAKQMVPMSVNQKNSKPLKRKQNSSDNNTSSQSSMSAQANKTKTSTSRPVSPTKIPSPPSASSTAIRSDGTNSTTNHKTLAQANKLKTPTSRPVSPTKTPTTTSISNASAHFKTKISSVTSTPIKTKASTTTSTGNKTKTLTTSTPPTATTTKKQPQKIMPPPAPFANPTKRSTVSTTIKEVSDKWKSSCDTLLTQISADPPNKSGGRTRDSKLPSTFWSRESMRYLDECVNLAAAQPNVLEKLQRVQNKSKNGQLSYNDYLAVIKLHTAITGK